jgi:hypothetical protein
MTKSCPGRFPQWMKVDCVDVLLQKELSFESDVIVTVYNKTSKDVIGAFSLDITSIAAQSEKPQFFNVINEEGQFMG